jgi:cytochrome P450
MTATFSTDNDFVRITDVCTALGVPRDDWMLFWRWADELPGRKAADELNAYVDVLIAERCRKPADDVLSRLIALDLTVDELRAAIGALVVKPATELSRCRPSRA